MFAFLQYRHVSRISSNFYLRYTTVALDRTAHVVDVCLAYTDNAQAIYLQNVTNYTHGPHICTETDRIEIHDFRSDEFGRAEQNLHFLFGIVFASEAEIDDLYAVSVTRQT